MELNCERCGEVFDSGLFRGYCDECVEFFDGQIELIHKRSNPSPGVHCVGRFNEGMEHPHTVFSGVANVCGCCGSDQIDPGYGYAAGGLGTYNFCHDCGKFLDFSEDLT